jgi:hypothetical protein
MNRHNTFGVGPKLLVSVLTVTLLSGCAKLESYVTKSQTTEAVCQELRADLPSYSAADTEQTITEGADFILLFQEVCAGYL